MTIKRFKAFLIDYLVISVYLIAILGINLLLNPDIFSNGLQGSEMDTQLLSFLASVLPITLVFAFVEARFGKTLGKYFMKINVNYPKHPYGTSLLRNAMKFLPWQLGHMSTIHALYVGTDAIFYLLTVVNFVWVSIYIIGFVWVKPYLPDRFTKATYSFQN
jgi:uncharacterized RDD family membrane protein YckC